MPAASRSIRVFISSTFRDMHAEREELVKRVFPQLRNLCEERGVGWTEVDLRWGVTEEQAQRGEVLPICLAEIDRCRPYFIGLLGERYGWVPGEIPRELVADQPWLAEHRGQSVTELEILHGVLRNPAMANRACFYLRDPSYVDRVPTDQRADFVEADSEAHAKLAALKDRIRSSGLAVRDYPDPQALGELVLRDLTLAINQEFPPEEAPDALQREALEHEAFALSRTGVYLGRPEYFDRLDAHAASTDDGPGLVVLGESGSGKSALLANWATGYRSEHPDDLVLMHFIGASPYGADWAAMLRRILGELKRRFGIEQEIPDQPDALRAAFANWLHMAAARVAQSPSAESGRKIVLIVDALNQLEDRDGAPDLVWLPPVIPGGVRLVVSTLPGRPLDELARRDWPTLEVQPFEPDERRQFVGDYLAQFTKSLSPARIDRIATAPATAKPLYLQALLEELRVFGVHERLDERIDHYLAATTVDGLYERILERYEADYERDRPGLVRDAMTLLWAARRGLSEAELLDLLGPAGEPLARAHWSPLYLAAEASLVSRSGLLGFFHDYLRQAVENRYLPTVEAQQPTHLRLADYFERQELTRRKIDELPWQLAEAASWQRLNDLLTDLPLFSALWDLSQEEVRRYWAQVEANSELRIVDGYRSAFERPALPHHVDRVATLLLDSGHPREAMVLQEVLVRRFRHAGDRPRLAACLGHQAITLFARGEPDEAMRLFREQERICRELGDRGGLQASLGGQSNIQHFHGRLDEAMRLSEEQEHICRELGNKDGLALCLGNRAFILQSCGNLEGAMRLCQEQERMCRELGDKDGLSKSLAGQALILRDLGKLDEAMRLSKEQEHICRELGDKHGLESSLCDQATILLSCGELDRAMILLQEQERICREVGSMEGLATSLGNQANILHAQGKLGRAMRHLQEVERIYRELGMKEGLATSLGHQATIFYALDELDAAMRLHKEEEGICREVGNKDGLFRSLGNQAQILADRGDPDGAMKLHQEVERICRELGSVEGIAISLANQAALLARNRNRPREALPLAEEAYRLARDHGYAHLAEQQIKPVLDTIRSTL